MTANGRDEAPGIAASWLLPGKAAGDGRVGVSVTDLVVCLEQVDRLHVFERTRRRDDQAAVIHWPHVLDRTEARSRAFDLGFRAAATGDRRRFDGQRGFEASLHVVAAQAVHSRTACP